MAVTHPSWSSYTKGCRCEDCRQAARDYSTDYRRRKALNAPSLWEMREDAPIVTDCGAEGRRTAYRNGCRCDACKRVESARVKAWRLARIAQATARIEAVTHVRP